MRACPDMEYHLIHILNNYRKYVLRDSFNINSSNYAHVFCNMSLISTCVFFGGVFVCAIALVLAI